MNITYKIDCLCLAEKRLKENESYRESVKNKFLTFPILLSSFPIDSNIFFL